MAIPPEVLVAITGLLGAAIGSLPGLFFSVINRRAEDKKNFNELVVKAATENWKFVVEHSQSSTIMPLEHYIIHTAKMCEFALSVESITPENTEKRLKEIESIMTVLENHAIAVGHKSSNPHKQ